jgi:hypothetical protein
MVSADWLPLAAVASMRTVVGAFPMAFRSSTLTQSRFIAARVLVAEARPAAWVTARCLASAEKPHAVRAAGHV